MEEEQDNMMQRADDEHEETEEAFSVQTICGIILFIIFLFLLGLIVIAIKNGLSDATVWNLTVFLSCLLVASFLLLFGAICYNIAKRRNRNITPGGLHRRAAQGGQPAVVQRRPEIGQRRNINVAGASRSSQAALLDTAPGPSGLQNPVVLSRSEQSLQLGQQRTQAESTLSEEGSSLLSSVSRDSSAASKMSDVASGVSDISSIRTTGRERIRTRSMTRKQLDEASTSTAGHPIDPSDPGPSHLRYPERSVRSLRSKKNEEQQSDRQSVLKSPVLDKSTAASRGVRRRENFAFRKGSLEKKLDYDDSESSDSE